MELTLDVDVWLCNDLQSETRLETLIDRRGLEHLYMSDCAISQIESGAFFDLVHLRWLDLSDNHLTTLSDGTFAGLHLHQLFLNGNRRLTLDGGRQFTNLTVSGLYLHDCRLSRLNADTFVPLIGSLRVLWLSENRLSRIGSELSDLFVSLDQFRLANNRLHCNCELSWLWRLYDEQSSNGDVPQCASPQSVRGKHFDELNEGDLRCLAPTLADVEVTLIDDDGEDRDDVGQSSSYRRRLVLRCTATGDPTPNVYWMRPAATTSGLPLSKSVPQADTAKDVGEALLELNEDTSSLRSQFTCVASNVVGNVTLTVRRVTRTTEVAVDAENDEVKPKYQHITNVTDTLDSDRHRLSVQRNSFSAERVKACSVLSIDRTDSSEISSSRELCGGRDRRLRASSTQDRRGVQLSSGSDELRQYEVEHVVGAVVLTVLLTASIVVSVTVVLLRHHGRSTSTLNNPRPTTDSEGRTVPVTTSQCDTVAYLNGS